MIEVTGLSKRYGTYLAVKDVSFSIEKGEVIGFLGPNGAGKSTIMNILTGYLSLTQGKVEIDGYDIAEYPEDAKRRIGYLPEIPPLYTDMKVREYLNFIYDLKKVKFPKKPHIDEILRLVKIDNVQNRLIKNLSKGYRQRVGFAQALIGNPDVLILDEPTASLTPQEIEELMEIISNLTADGKSVILITHKLKEITESSDNCTIIRAGKYIDTVKIGDVDENKLAAMMVGRDVNFKVEKKDKTPGNVALEIKDLHAKDYRGVEILKGFDLNVKSGEIVGLAGVDGNGQTELVEILTGLRKAESGSITMLGKDVLNKKPKEIFESGISSIPADRQKYGLVLDFSIEDNLISQHFEEKPYSNHMILDRKKIREHATEMMDRFDIRPRGAEAKPAGTLSGGNQQKVIIAREVTNDKELLIAVNPTRGLDVGAIEFVHKYIVEQRDKGRAVLLVSFELDEIMNLSDRIEVIFDGQIKGSVSGKDADEKELGYMMAGGKKNEN